MVKIRGYLKQILNREQYIREIKMTYGIIIQEFRAKDGQKCGYFHILSPEFREDQKPGEIPEAFSKPKTEFTEALMKQYVRNLLNDEWYKQMCESWCNEHPIIGENIWED